MNSNGAGAGIRSNEKEVRIPLDGHLESSSGLAFRKESPVHRIPSLLREHRHFLIVVTLLTLVTTFPTIVYVFRTDVFWHPAGTDRDVYIKFWDVWYGKQFLTGQADRFYTDLMFHPEGLSLTFHPFFIPHIFVVNALDILLPISNAFSLSYLLIIFLCALSGYVYLRWLFEDKWIALFGAVVFGFSPHVVGHANHPDIACIATIPQALYCFHRGIKENRRVLIALAGLLTGLTTVVTLYGYTCLVITLGLFILALAMDRWRDKSFWLNMALLILAISLSSFWRIYPLVTHSESLSNVAEWHGESEVKTDAISYFVNHQHPLLARPLHAILQTPYNVDISPTSYLGYLPLLLIGIGLLTKATRQRMMPWVLLCALFLLLRLGSRLVVNGVVYPDILLPKFYLNQLFPEVFLSFWEADNYMTCALLPLAVLACYGLVALRARFASLTKPVVLLALVVIVALEYHIPVRTSRIFPAGDGTISQERLAFLDWLNQEDGEIRLVNLPMGRKQSKIYNLYQSLSGYPQAEGAISRTPDSAFDYIRANLLLNAWHQHQPISCELVDRELYLSALAQLETDGFSHVVYHRDLKDAEAVKSSFRFIEPAYENTLIWIFRLSDLRHSCSAEQGASLSFSRAYADALRKLPILDDRHGIALLFPPGPRETKQFLHDLRHFARRNRTIMTVSSDAQTTVTVRRPDMTRAISSSEPEQHAALWLVNHPQTFDAQETPAFRQWFAEHFNACRRVLDEANATIDLYLRADIPCNAMDESSALNIDYDGGVRLHNASFVQKEDLLHFYLAWTNATPDSYGFSLQFFDENGDKALQYDNVVYRDLLSTHEIDPSSLPAGDFSIQLIVYDFETQVSHGGFVAESGRRFDRALEIGKLYMEP